MLPYYVFFITEGFMKYEVEVTEKSALLLAANRVRKSNTIIRASVFKLEKSCFRFVDVLYNPNIFPDRDGSIKKHLDYVLSQSR